MIACFYVSLEFDSSDHMQLFLLFVYLVVTSCKCKFFGKVLLQHSLTLILGNNSLHFLKTFIVYRSSTYSKRDVTYCNSHSL